MIDSKYRISLDIHSTTSNVRLKCKRGDTSRIICATLTENGFPYHISEDCYAVFTAPKPDGNVVYNKCKINDNVIEYEFTPQTAAVSGVMKCEIKLYGADDKLITSPSFVLVVSDTAYDEGDEIESEKEVDALTHLISESTEAIKKAERVPNFGINAKVGQYLKISKVGPDGKVIEVIPVDPPAGGSYGSGDLDMKGCNVERVGSLDFEPSNDDYSQAFWMQAGGDIKNADGSQTAVAEFYSSESDLPVVLRHIANGMQDDDAANIGQLKTRLPAPLTAVAGQYIRITAVDENGVVTAVEAVDAPSGGVGADEVFVKLEDGTVVSGEVEFDLSDENTPSLVVAPHTAEVGQAIVVKAVDENGKPTEWEAVDLPSGGSDVESHEACILADFTLEEDVEGFTVPLNDDPFNYSSLLITITATLTANGSGQYWGYISNDAHVVRVCHLNTLFDVSSQRTVIVKVDLFKTKVYTIACKMVDYQWNTKDQVSFIYDVEANTSGVNNALRFTGASAVAGSRVTVEGVK